MNLAFHLILAGPLAWVLFEFGTGHFVHPKSALLTLGLISLAVGASQTLLFYFVAAKVMRARKYLLPASSTFFALSFGFCFLTLQYFNHKYRQPLGEFRTAVVDHDERSASGTVQFDIVAPDKGGVYAYRFDEPSSFQRRHDHLSAFKIKKGREVLVFMSMGFLGLPVFEHYYFVIPASAKSVEGREYLKSRMKGL